MTEKPERPTGEQHDSPRIVVVGIGGAGGNAVNNMIQAQLAGVEFLVANTDAQALHQSRCDRCIQMGRNVTQGLGAGSRPDIGRAAAEEALDEIMGELDGANMVFVTAGMGGGTGTGAAPVIARAAREAGILTVGVVTKPFHFEGVHRMRLAEAGITELTQYVDTLIVIPNQNLFRVANDKTTFADAFKLADHVLHAGVRGVTDLMVMPGLINLDFADIRAVMAEMGKAIMGTGEAEGEGRAIAAAEAAISNPLLDEMSMKGARGVLINITGGLDLTLFEVDQAANRIRDEVDPEANIIFGSTFDETMEGRMRISVVATGIDAHHVERPKTVPLSLVINRAPKRGEAAAPAAEAVADAAAEAPDLARPEAGVGPAREARAEDERTEDERAADERAEEGPAAEPRAAEPAGPEPAGPETARPEIAASATTPRAAERVEAARPEIAADTAAPPREVEPAVAAPPGRQADAAPARQEPAPKTGFRATAEPTPQPALGPAAPPQRDVAGPVGAKPLLAQTETALRAPSPPRERPGGPPATKGQAPEAEPEPKRRRGNPIFTWMTGAGQSSPDELFEKGERYYYGQGVRKNPALAFKSYLRAAEQGHAAAQNRLGWMYEKGEGVEADHVEAVTWYRRAAEQGHVNAMNDLGYMFRQGWGVPQSYSEALHWFSKAAAKYDSYAEYNMGQMYEFGWGVEKNLDEAIRWFRRSAARGHEWAAKRLEELGVKS